MAVITCSNCKRQGHRYTNCKQPLKPDLQMRKNQHQANITIPEEGTSVTPAPTPSVPPVRRSPRKHAGSAAPSLSAPPTTTTSQATTSQTKKRARPASTEPTQSKRRTAPKAPPTTTPRVAPRAPAPTAPRAPARTTPASGRGFVAPKNVTAHNVVSKLLPVGGKGRGRMWGILHSKCQEISISGRSISCK